MDEKNNHTNLGKTFLPPIGLKYNSELTLNEAKDYLAGKYNFLVVEIEVFTVKMVI